jgi:cardiolipin synthase
LIPVIVLVFFGYPDKPTLPAAIFCAAALTDMVDGLIAKKFNMVSDIGKVLDPLADKLFFNTILLCFVIKTGNIILAVLLAISVTKELYMIICGTLLYKRKLIFASKFIGKAATFVLNCGLLFYFFAANATVKTIAETLLLVGLGLSLAAAIYYTVTIYKQTGGKLPPKEKHSEPEV